MKRAWKMLKKEFAETFGKCLKASWALEKKTVKFFTDKELTQEEATEIMKKNSNFWKHCQVQKLEGGEWGNRTYIGKGVQTFELNAWIVKGRARIYAKMLIDGWEVKKTYVEVLV
jgi:hypothetical protein